MLEAAAVRRPGFADGSHNIGRILDAMLYYDRVHLVIDHPLFNSLAERLGLDGLSTLLSHDTITASLTPESVAVRRQELNGIVTYAANIIQFAGDQKRSIPTEDTIGVLHTLIKRHDGWADVRRRDLERALRPARDVRYKQLLGPEAEKGRILRSLIMDEATLKLFLQQWLAKRGRAINEQSLQALTINVLDLDTEFLIATSESIDSLLATQFETPFQWGGVLNEIHDYSIDLFLAQNYSADLVGSPEVGEIADRRIDLSLQRASRSANRIRAFESMVFERAGYLGGAFNEGHISLADSLRLIDRSRKMRTWVRGLPPDADIVREYHAEISRESVFDRLPGSAARFTFFALAATAIDATLGPPAAIALSAFDFFALEHILKGWRPNIFVENAKKAVGRKRP